MVKVNVEPSPGFDSHPDRAAHELAQPAGDREAEAGAAVDAGGGDVDLGERREEPLRRLRLDTDARVAHRRASS